MNHKSLVEKAGVRRRVGRPLLLGNNKIDEELKIKSDRLFKELGMDTTTAIRIFLTQAVANDGFPFEIKRMVQNPYDLLTEEELLQKLKKSREAAARREYRPAESVVSDVKEKYGL